jgi:predicted metal-binding membrane protein
VAEPSLAESLLRRDRIILYGLIGLLFMLAGLYTVYGVGMRMTALEMTAMRGMRDMPGANVPGDWSLAYALLIFLMWWVMMIAMMLPSVSPTVLLYAALLRRGSDPIRVPTISTAFLAGYLAAWAGFSALAAASQWALEALGIVSATMMTLTQTIPGAIVLIAAGVFQFTPLKQACLRHCRSPVEFITQRRRGGTSGAFTMGIEHGVYCLGCCWFLMALLFVGGIMNLYWIVGLTAFVTIEKLVSHGHLLSKMAGAGLTLWGGLVLWSAI